MYEQLLRHPFMSATGVARTDARVFVDAMCRVEIALAQVQENAGHVAEGTARDIARRVHADVFDIDALAAAAPDGGNVAIAFVKQAQERLPAELRSAFHRGATSQDIIDSALMLVLQPRLERCLDLLARCRSHGCDLMAAHQNTPMIGRTLMQQALPISFGAKVAHWLWGLIQAEKRLATVTHHGLYVQFGGPVGIHADWADDGLELMEALAAELGLTPPVLPWHTDRQPVLAIVDAVGVVAVAAEKIALDVGLMAQTEIGELAEPPATGSGGSSSMPHKRNPVGCARICAAARQIHAVVGLLHNAGAQPLERGLGEWHAEWAPLVDATLLLEGALETQEQLLAGLEVYPDAMRRNLALSDNTVDCAAALGTSRAQIARVRAIAESI